MVRSILRHWPLQALILLLILDLGSCASVPGLSKGERVDPPASEYDDEASVQDGDEQNFLYHNVAESNSQFPDSKDLGDGKEDVSEGKVESDGSIELTDEELKEMLEKFEENLQHPGSIRPGDMPMYWSPFLDSSIGAPTPGTEADGGLVPISLSVRRELVRKILGESGGPPNDVDRDCSHCKCGKDFTIPDGFVYNPLIAAAKEAHRSKRSSDDYWYSLGEPNRHLEENDVNYAIRNDLRQRLEKTSNPLHYGHIYTGNIGNPNDYGVHDRAFGPDADFDFPRDIHAFKYKPHGPRLNNLWRKHGYPIYSHNLYKLRGNIRAMEFGRNGKGQVVTISGGVYRFVSVTKKGDVLMTNVKTHKRFLVPELFLKQEESRKFQAISPWKDHNGVYLPVRADGLGGDAYIIKGTPLTGNNPKRGNYLLHHGLGMGPPAPPGSVLDRDKGKKRPEGIQGAPKHP